MTPRNDALRQLINAEAARLSPTPGRVAPTSAPRAEFNKAAKVMAPAKAPAKAAKAPQGGSLGALAEAVIGQAILGNPAAIPVALGGALLAEPLSKAKQAMIDSSGGELPPARPGAGAPTKAAPLESRPKSASELYDLTLQAIFGGGGPDISYRQLGNLAGAVPGAPKPPSAKDVILEDLYTQAATLYQSELVAAQQAKDPEAEASAVERFRQRTMPLVTSNMDFSTLLAGGSKE